MPISPFLDDLLTQWLSRGSELRKEVEFQKELIVPAMLAAHGNRLALRQRRQRYLRELEQVVLDAETRWQERLNRIEEWRQSASALENQSTHLQRLVQGMMWLKKARSKHQASFMNRFERHIQSLRVRERALSEQLQIWEGQLRERIALLGDLLQKGDADKPLYVSRARKQPEIDFLNEQLAMAETIGAEMSALRRSWAHWHNRLNRAHSAIQNQADGAEVLYEMHKQELLSGLKESETTLMSQRDAILTTALLHEGCRHQLRKLQTQIRGLHCVEDIPKAARTRGFKNLFRTES